MPDEIDTDVPEVLGGEFGQQRGVDRIFAKRRFVLLQSEAVEPSRDVHACILDADPRRSVNPTLDFKNAGMLSRAWWLAIASGIGNGPRYRRGPADAGPLGVRRKRRG